MKKSLRFLFLVLLLAILAAPGSCKEEVIIADFEDGDITDWGYKALRWDTELHKPVADETQSPLLLSINENPTYVKAGEMSLKVVYKKAPGVGPLYAEIPKRLFLIPQKKQIRFHFGSTAAKKRVSF